MISPAKLASSLFLLEEEESNRSNLLQIRNRTNLDVGMKSCGEVSTTDDWLLLVVVLLLLM